MNSAPPHNATSSAAIASKDHSADIDAIQARIDIQTSKARSLVASWLPQSNPLTAPPGLNEDDDEMLFKPVPPGLGVGAPIPTNFHSNHHGGTDVLRRTMLGGTRKPTKPMPQSDEQQGKASQAEDSDEDIGRSALGGIKRKKSIGSNLRKTKLAKPGKVGRTTPSASNDKVDLTPEQPQTDTAITKIKKKEQN